MDEESCSSLKSRGIRLKHLTERLQQAPDPETKRKIGGVIVQIVAADLYLSRHFGGSVLTLTVPSVDA